ncbi:MAG: sigma-54 dependent transcriptional regulator [Gammaproteobacteria bacterium]|nr:sigma-54 dependent transcriptional regulator [Gammaproteobacteria bacterium]MCI0590572.1 sigma-54 dependent transcriptional regulator [Gammaproteobacteria bacterium]
MSPDYILVVDDEPDIRSLVKEILEDEGFAVSVAENGEQCRHAWRTRRPDLVLLDIWMPDVDGITLLKEWTEDGGLDIPVIMMSGHGSVETAVEATRLGAYDFIEKPLSLAKLLLTVRRALEATSLQRENIRLRHHAQPISEPIGKSVSTQRLREQVKRIAHHNTSVLITGESGSGKELVARYLHANSNRSEAPFIAVGVAGLGGGNAATELFGGEKDGKVHFGYLEQAHAGTLFVKEIADIDLNLQARFLGVINHHAFSRVGGLEPVATDVRIVAAASCNLDDEVRAGRFREDLYYHLNVVPIRVPPLREHYEDVPELLDFYVNNFAAQEGLPYRRFTVAAQNRLRSYSWPGNVRELKNLVQRLLILGNGGDIGIDELEGALGMPPRLATYDTLPGFNLPLREAREQFERAYLKYQLREAGGSVSKVASKINVERTHLYRKLRLLGIDVKAIGENKRQ